MLFVIRVTYVTPFALPIHGNQHSQHPKNYINQNHETIWNVIQNIQPFNVQGLKDKEIKKKLIDTQCESDLILLLKNFDSLENIAIASCR